MTSRARSLLATALTIAAVGGLLTAIVQQSEIGLIAWVGYPLAGWYITFRRPENRVGWLLISVGVAWAFAFGLVPAAESGNVWLDLLSSLGLLGGLVTMGWIPIIFPNGTPNGRRGRLLQRSMIIVAGLAAVATLVSSESMSLSGVTSPLAIPTFADAASFVNGPGFDVAWLVIVLGGFVDMLLRWRQSAGVARLQYRWLVAALGFVVVALALNSAVPGTSPPAQVVASLAISLIPVSIGIAVLRYRLYEIDRIVSRTVTYALVALIVATVYTLPVVLLPRLLGESNSLVVAASTLAAAAIFNPARRRIQLAVDKRFNRARYDAEHQLERFANRIHSQTDLASIRSQLNVVVSATVAPEKTALWIR